jgi:D-alanyl-D-alanine carboxypeptidase
MALESDLSISRQENASLTDALQTEQGKNTAFADQISNIASTVGTLQKLSQTDPELLKKYSKVYFLNENYIPSSLSDISPEFLSDKSRTLKIHTEVLPHLEELLRNAASSSMTIQIASAYRSFKEQTSLKSSYKVIYGSGANKFSADQGYSEHQLGTAVDFTTPKIGGGLTGFDKTPEYQWLLDNAHKFGFIISYPKDNAYYQFEPWHWRYVGITLATNLHDENKHFYDMDQREIDSYLIHIFD